MRLSKELLRKIVARVSKTVQELYFSQFPDLKLMKQFEGSPPGLTIETINVCNANCIFCAYQYQERPKQVMDEELFKKALHDFLEMGGGDLSLTVVVGDPLLDPKFVDRIRYARSFSKIRNIRTNTNGLHLHKVGVKDLLTSGLTSICVSTTGFNPEMYQRVFRSQRYLQMKQNVLDLLKINHELGRPVKVTVSLRIDKPFHEVMNYPDFEEVRKLADNIDTNRYFDNWSGKIKSEDLTGNMKLRPAVLGILKKKFPCSQLYTGIGVLVDGTVTACACRDLNGDSDLVLGNIKQATIKEMWHSQYLKSLRDGWFKRKAIPNICRDCSHYNPYTYLMLSEVKQGILAKNSPT